MDNSIYLGMRFATSSFNNKIDLNNIKGYWRYLIIVLIIIVIVRDNKLISYNSEYNH